MVDAIIIGILAVVLFLSIRSIVKAKARGASAGCGCGCSGCSVKASCPSHAETKK